ncbi:MAG: hypothetical protein LAP85_14900 [Acidobacteriia bacterium]|nr:hypothetical protein [Terriglobia bacterium]
MRTPTVFSLGRWTIFASMVLGGLAMLLYPGGTRRDPSTIGYRFFQNFLSDLGNTVAFSGQSNRVSSILALTVCALMVPTVLACILAFVRLYSLSRSRRRIAIAAAVLTAISCVGMMGVAMSPGNLALTRHVRFSLLTLAPWPVASLLFAVVTVRDDRFRWGVPAAWLALTFVSAGLLSVRLWGPSITTDIGLTMAVTAQKIAMLTALGVFVYQTCEADRLAARARKAAAEPPIGESIHG